MNTFPPNSAHQLGYMIPIDPIEDDIWCESFLTQHSNSKNQHSRSLKSNQLAFAGTRQNNDTSPILDISNTREKLQSSPIECRSMKDDESIMEFCPFNYVEFEEEASSLGLLQIENMADSFTNQLIFPNTIDSGVPMCLGADFKPSNYHVICGRGKRAYNHVGNRRFKLTMAMNLRKYVDTNTFSKKMDIVDAVIDQIREATGCTNGTGFVKVDSAGNWFDVGIEEAREKTARAFRDFSTAGSAGTKWKNFNWATCWEDERNKRVIDIQNSIFNSCQIKFSGRCNRKTSRR